MSAPGVHYELHVRRRTTDGWTLDHAGENRDAVVAAAKTAMAERRFVAVCVRKELFDEATGTFVSIRVMEMAVDGVGAPAPSKPDGPVAPPCTSPADLYTSHARDRIARLMEAVLRREKVTAWELLHRPDLAEKLEATGLEIQGAIQRIAIPEAQARGGSTHEMVRAFQKLTDAAVKRLISDGRRNAFPAVDPAGFAETCARLPDDAEGAYRLGGGVAAHLRDAVGWRAKAERLAALLAAAPAEGRARALAVKVLEPPLAEMLGGAAPLADLVGAELDLGGQLAVLMRIAARREVELLARIDPEIAGAVPPLEGPTARLAELLEDTAFDAVRAALSTRILAELTGPRRLRPGDPNGEITILRALAAVLAAAVGRLVPREEVQSAFVERSKRLVAADFVGLYLADRGGALAEVRALARLCGNLTGPINKRDGARWLLSILASLRFEKEVRHGPDAPGARLAALAALQRVVDAAGLPGAEQDAAHARLGEAGAWVDDESRVIGSLARSEAPALTRLAALMRLATGDAAPDGPVRRRAHQEAQRLARSPEMRAAATRPELLPLLHAAAAGPAGEVVGASAPSPPAGPRSPPSAAASVA